ncbi:hypothetical protein BH11BAC3_BH11BAC3_29890 [soil metagenome]
MLLFIKLHLYNSIKNRAVMHTFSGLRILSNNNYCVSNLIVSVFKRTKDDKAIADFWYDTTNRY